MRKPWSIISLDRVHYLEQNNAVYVNLELQENIQDTRVNQAFENDEVTNPENPQSSFYLGVILQHMPTDDYQITVTRYPLDNNSVTATLSNTENHIPNSIDSVRYQTTLTRAELEQVAVQSPSTPPSHDQQTVAVLNNQPAATVENHPFLQSAAIPAYR